MAELIVLGIIPGTSFQITFGLWILAMVIAAIAAFSVYAKRRNYPAALLIALMITLQTRRLLA